MVPAAGLIAWLVPQALAQTWEQPLHPETSYPRELLATGDPQNIPLLGDSSHPLSRIALVGERNGEPVLTDPFSDEVFLTLTEEETATVGDSPSVMERFGELPEKQFMLTFDDGPDATFTPDILDVLSAEGVPATFFNIGTNVVAQPELFRRNIREGHMVVNTP